MSANGATERRTDFERWLASLKRDQEQAAEGDATRVHHVPKDLIRRLRAQAAAKALEAPHAERTAVFRAPPELLELTKRAMLQEESAKLAEQTEDGSSSPQPASSSDELDPSEALLDWTESRSGIAQRPHGLGAPPDSERLGMAEAELPSVIVAEEPELSQVEAARGDASMASFAASEEPTGADVDELLASNAAAYDSVPPAPALMAQSNALSAMSHPSIPPKFRQPLAHRIAFVVAALALAALVVWVTR
jgi:hypothetical protein